MFQPSTADGLRRVRMYRFASALGLVFLLPLFAAACVFDGDDDDADTALPASNASAATQSTDAQPVRQDSITLTEDGFEPDAIEVDEGAVVRVTNDTGDAISISVSGGDSNADFEILAGAEIEMTLETPGARVITVPGDTGLTATVMVLAAATEEAR